jgi:hypothetical protein
LARRFHQSGWPPAAASRSSILRFRLQPSIGFVGTFLRVHCHKRLLRPVHTVIRDLCGN